jgi:TonB family protein
MATGSRNLLTLVLLAAASVLFINTRAAAQPEGGGAIMAITEKPSSGGGRASSGTSEGQGKTAGSKTSAALPRNSVGASTPKSNRSVVRPAPASNPNYNGPVIGDKYSFLNFEIAEKVQPIWTLKAQNAGALGLVQVEVLIDPNGYVLTAHARTGNPMLHPEAERAALATRFNKPTANGRPVRAFGFIVYRFGTEEQEYEQEQKSKQKNSVNSEPGYEATPSSIVGGVLNGKAVSLPKPSYPAAAKSSGAKGAVWVQVEVGENGNVVSATANSGDPLLLRAAEEAARRARFSPTLVNGKPVRVTGILVYNFTPPGN